MLPAGFFGTGGAVMRQGEGTRGQQQTTPQADDPIRDTREVERREELDQELDADVESRRAASATTSTWQQIKSRFVDDPEGALAEAEDLVRSAVEERVRRMKQGLDELRGSETGEGASKTEERRTRLIRYQAYYESIRGTTAH
jgi:hypothetical protein